MNPISWLASWIWIPPFKPTTNVYAEFRRSIKLDKPVRRAVIHLSANQEYILYVDGRPVGRGPSPADSAWKYYDSYELPDAAGQSEIGIAAVVYNFGTTDITINQFQGPGGFIAQLECELADGSAVVIGTDESWQCRHSPRYAQTVTRQSRWGGYREIYYADQEDGWEQPGYSPEKPWSDAVVVCAACEDDSPWPRLLPREIPQLARSLIDPVRLMRLDANDGLAESQAPVGADLGGRSLSCCPLRLDASVAGSLPGALLDFGQETVGYPRLVVEAPEGGVLQLSYGESLELQLYDTFRLKKGRNLLAPFGRRAFRYMHIAAMATPQPIAIMQMNNEQVHYPFAERGSFNSPDTRLNRIWQVGVHTTMMNSHDHLEDCPLREKALWVADGVVMGKVIYHTFGDKALLRKCLLQGARIQNEDGSIPGTGPERNRFMLPDFCAHWLFGVTSHYAYTGDIAFLQELWPTIERLLGWFEAQEDEDGLFARADRVGWWCFIDWATYIDRRDRVTAISCFYYKALQLAAELADTLGHKEQAQRWREKAPKLRAAVRGRLWSDEHGAFADCLTAEGLSVSITLQTNFTAIWTEVMEREEAETFLHAYYDSGKAPELKGAFFYHIVLETLFRYDRYGQAIKAIAAYWGGMLDRGATTWWEVFDPSSPGCTVPSPYQGNTPTYMQDHIPVSLCHGWGASPTYLLTQYVLGIDVSQLGQAVVRLRTPPVEVALPSARGEVPTPIGAIRVEWERDDAGICRFAASVPKGLTAEVIPASPLDRVTVSYRE
ncbi:MAG: alpha-L-rhamnosidase [Paenibacillus sp.]|nr:alpha-L-rhamnosidase [Paenibacillus sp.]